MKRALGWIVALVVGGFITIVVVQAGSAPQTAATEGSATTAVEQPAKVEGSIPVASNWDYTGDKNEITGKPRSWACTLSADRGAQLCFRRGVDGLDSYISIDHSQSVFYCLSSGCSVKIRADDMPSIAVAGTEGANGGSQIIFLSNSAKLLALTRKTKQLKIEAPFYQDGPVVLHFNVAGIRW